MRNFTGFFFIFLLAATASAETATWVSVASFSNQADADAALESMRPQLGSGYQIVRADTARGTFYRVASGPFSDGTQERDRARMLGFSDAWVFRSPIGQTDIVSADSDNLDQSFTEFDYEAELQALDAALDLPEYTPLEPLEGSSEHAVLPELIEEAPSSYRLNRLRRED